MTPFFHFSGDDQALRDFLPVLYIVPVQVVCEHVLEKGKAVDYLHDHYPNFTKGKVFANVALVHNAKQADGDQGYGIKEAVDNVVHFGVGGSNLSGSNNFPLEKIAGQILKSGERRGLKGSEF